MRIVLWTILNNIGTHPDDRASLQISRLRVKCHDSESVENEEKDSVQAHTIEERNHHVVVVNEPLEVLLEDTLTRAAVLLKNSIEARLRGGGAIATGVKFNPGFANASDQMAVQIHIRHIAAADNLSVCQFEILTLENGIVHLTFDLPHESVELGFGGGWGSSLPLMWPIYGSQGALTRGLVPVVALAQGSTGLLFNVTFNLTGFNIIQQLQ
jgi:hypothetical protein